MMKRFYLVALALCAMLSAQQPSPAVPTDGAPFKIAGTLVDAVTGAPLSHSTITLAPVMKRDNTRTVVTAEGGQFLFENLDKGKYVLSAQRRGYISQAFNQHDQYSTYIAVGPDLDSTSLVFKLRPESSILGTIIDNYGEPVANAQVRLFQISVPSGRRGVGLQRRLVTNDEGLYRFSHLPPGDYYLAVSARPWYVEDNRIRTNIQPKVVQPVQEDDPALDMAYPITFFPGVTEWNAARVIPLGVSGSFTADIILQPVRAAHVHIKSRDLDPSRGLTATLTQTVAGDMAMDISPVISFSAKNEIELTGFAPGNYKLGLSITNSSEPGQKVLNRSSRLLDASANAEVSVEQSVPAVSVTGSVKLDSGSLPARGALQLRERYTGEAVYATISPQGEFEFSQGVLPGMYDLVVSNLPDMFVRSISAADGKVTGQTVSIGSSPAKLTVTLTQGTAKIDGVAQREGKPVSGAMILLVPQDPSSNPGLFRRDQSDSDGSFALAAVLPGKYTALALENGWEMEWSNPEVLKPFLPGGEAIQVEAKGNYVLKLKVQ
ncbi:MAG TPA: carboxypeptidase regulatory-like domain-containing protein [Candidatus Angelobacter sp.]|nr:carboxypeptidase regulatory-like domain-containing protein [Candidatus Angelobacter sp.]